MSLSLRQSNIETPLGPMLAVADDNALRMLEFTARPNVDKNLQQYAADLDATLTAEVNEPIAQITEELEKFFAGELKIFETRITTVGTPFQRQVWETLRTIEYGQRWSYQQLAQSIGRPAAVRAVAKANATNRLAIIIPCHRVIGADGSLRGYAGGVDRKRALLDLEGQPAPLWHVGV